MQRTRRVVYQVLPRLFGNGRAPARPGGSLAENGCGRLADLDARALRALAELGVNTLWLTGVLEHATGTAHPGLPADDPDIVKGSAGSPYAVRDLFDVAADLATTPARRLEELRELITRCHSLGLEVWIDLVPNHVARSHRSDVHPEFDLGRDDNKSTFFARDNHFFYLTREHPGGGPPLRLPNQDAAGCDGLFAPETAFGRVTGNNAATWAPSLGDWYETVKLNFGHDYTRGRDTSHLPGPNADSAEVPRTWRLFDAVVAHWQTLGVDGFRVDMAHLVPLEFWAWLIPRARARAGHVTFCAEAYDNDPAKLCDGHVMDALLSVGFDTVYDDPIYDLLEGLYEDGKWCNDLDAAVTDTARFARSLRYGENHDEVRLAHPTTWGGLGMEVGRPVCAVLYLLGPGPLMLYMGQEVGEAALGDQGFAGDNARTSIFDYTWCPELAKWRNGGACDGGGLSAAQRDLRGFYGALLRLAQRPPFLTGATWPLNGANVDNPAYARVPGEAASGHWLYTFARGDRDRLCVVAANFHPTAAATDVRVRWSKALRALIGAGRWTAQVALGPANVDSAHMLREVHEALHLPAVPPLDAVVVELLRQ